MSAETLKQAHVIIKKMDLSKVDLKLVRKHLKDAKLSYTGTADECVERLMVHQIQTGGKDLLECDVCHGFSAAAYEDCPFCDGVDPAGKKAAVVETTGEETTEAPAKPAKASKKASKKPEEAPAPVATTSTEVEKLSKKSSKKAAAKAEKPAKAEKAPKESTRATKKTASKKAPEQPPVKPTIEKDGKTIILTTKHLDAEVIAIKKAQVRGTDAIFEVGQRMLKIREQGLHTLRVDPETKKPIYKRLEDFTQAELGMTRVHAQVIMNVAEGFKPEDVREVGVAKLGLFVGLKSKELRDKLLEVAKSGGTVSEIREEVKKLTASGAERTRREGFRGTPATGPRKTPSASDPITVATTEQAITVPFLTEKGAQATKFVDGLVGQETTANGILITYKLVILEGIGVGLEVTRVRAPS